MSENKIELYHPTKTYLEGWYTLDDLKRITKTAERIEQVNIAISNQHTPMKEMIPIPEVGWMTMPNDDGID